MVACIRGPADVNEPLRGEERLGYGRTSETHKLCLKDTAFASAANKRELYGLGFGVF